MAAPAKQLVAHVTEYVGTDGSKKLAVQSISTTGAALPGPLALGLDFVDPNHPRLTATQQLERVILTLDLTLNEDCDTVLPYSDYNAKIHCSPMAMSYARILKVVAPFVIKDTSPGGTRGDRVGFTTWVATRIDDNDRKWKMNKGVRSSLVDIPAEKQDVLLGVLQSRLNQWLGHAINLYLGDKDITPETLLKIQHLSARPNFREAHETSGWKVVLGGEAVRRYRQVLPAALPAQPMIAL